MKIHNFTKYKEALRVIPQLEVILKILTLTENALVLYKQYSAVQRILYTLREEKFLIEWYLDEYKRVKKNKGKKVL